MQRPRKNLRALVNRRRRASLAFAMSIVGCLLLGLAAPAVGSTVQSPGPSTDAFVANGAWSYRYGPSMVIEGTTINMLTCSPGSGGFADFIRYSQSTDAGATWSGEQVIIQPTAGGADAFSNCDPSVVKFGGYYYVAYTGVASGYNGGVANQIFVARSASITGPYDKWNGSGWGGNPQPFITYAENSYDYGAGEPSLVVKDTTLYVYYHWVSHDPSSGLPTNQTRLATTSTANANWPAAMSYQGVAFNERQQWNPDSADVKYIPSWGKFIAVHSLNRFGPRSRIQAWESTDGLKFTPSSMLGANLLAYLNNDGLSGDDLGQVDPTHPNYIGYAYGSIFGTFSLAVSPVTYTNDNVPARPLVYSVQGDNGSLTVDFQTDSKATSYSVQYGTTPGSYTSSVTGISSSPYTLTGLTNGTTYYLTVTAVNAYGASPASSPVAVTAQNFQKVTPTAVSASSSLANLGMSPQSAIDNDPNTFWSSVSHTSSSATEWLSVDLGSVQSVGRVAITLRQPLMMAGPDLSSTDQTSVVETSSDGATWSTVDSRVLAAPALDSSGVNETVFTFAGTVNARYVRIRSTKLLQDNYGNYYLQLGELSVYSAPAGSSLQPPVIAYTPSSSSSVSGSMGPSMASDGNINTFWSSASHTVANGTEWIQADFGNLKTIQNLFVQPRQGYCFPSAFTIQSSNDGTTWSQIPGQRYSNYVDPSSAGTNPDPIQQFHFDVPVSTRYIRIVASTLRPDNFGVYYFQIAELAITG